jgi:hypothetical protein
MISKTIYFTVLILSATILTACASSTPAPSENPDQPAAEAAPQFAGAEIADDYDGDGLELTLDGSSIEAFDASMARIKRHTDEASYTSLNGAVGYLLVYDLEARGDKEKLIAKLDGKTGYEVLNMVGWRKPAPGKSPAEKGSADAKILDT